MKFGSRAMAITVALAATGVGCGGWDRQSITSYSVDGADRLMVNGHCNDDGRVRVTEQDSDQVLLRLETEGGRRGDCLVCVAVDLDAPLGDRKVIDAGNGELVPLSPDGC